MKNLKKTFNAIAAQDASGLQTNTQQSGKCCEALNSFNASYHMTAITSALEYLIGATPPTNPLDPDMERHMLSALNAKKYLSNNLKGFFNNLMDNICDCINNLPQKTANRTSMFTSTLSRPSNLTTEQSSDFNCFNKLARMLGGNASQFTDVHEEYFPSASIHNKLFLEVFTKMLYGMARTFSRDLTNGPYLQNSSYMYFFKEMCKYRKTNPTQYQQMVNSFWASAGMEYGSMLYEQTLLVADDTEENITVNCPPSANDNTIGALAAALGVSAAVVAVALAALRRGKTKQCSDVAVTARNLTPLLIAATGASFATTQTSEATVQERLQAVLQKDCEGRLPYSCGEGGFEGSDDGDDSGEVDAPGGGGGIGGG